MFIEHLKLCFASDVSKYSGQGWRARMFKRFLVCSSHKLPQYSLHQLWMCKSKLLWYWDHKMQHKFGQHYGVLCPVYFGKQCHCETGVHVY
jgi:hypothetical protein